MQLDDVFYVQKLGASPQMGKSCYLARNLRRPTSRSRPISLKRCQMIGYRCSMGPTCLTLSAAFRPWNLYSCTK